jgi:4'-phosphopantetheinyl transferase
MTIDLIQVWLAILDVPADEKAELADYLSADEQARASRYGHPQVRERFTVGRGLLRRILAGCLDCDPRELAFGYGPHGKPHLLGAPGVAMSFNISHSGSVAVYAVARGQAVGVDIEQIRPDRATHELAQRYFATGEVKALRDLPAEERVAAFFRCWSRKEAFIKAIGDGLAFPLDEFEVSLAPGEPAALLAVRGDPAAARTWSLHDLVAPPGFAAAVAVAGQATLVVRDTANVLTAPASGSPG